jgi:nitrogen regulatory protein P-II 1
VPDIVEVAPTRFVTAKIRLEIIGDDDFADAVVCRLAPSANRDRPSDGMIFVLPLEDAVRIRTGEHGLDAV